MSITLAPSYHKTVMKVCMARIYLSLSICKLIRLERFQNTENYFYRIFMINLTILLAI